MNDAGGSYTNTPEWRRQMAWWATEHLSRVPDSFTLEMADRVIERKYGRAPNFLDFVQELNGTTGGKA